MDAEKTMLDVLLERNEQISVFSTMLDVIHVASTCRSTSHNFKWYPQSLHMGHTLNTTKSLEFVALNCPQLTSLNMFGCGYRGDGNVLQDSALEHVLQSCPKVQCLQFAYTIGVTDATMDVIARCCPGLTSLDITNCIEVTEEGLETLVRRCPNIRTLKRELSHEDEFDEDLMFSDDYIAVLSSHCPHLEELDISGTIVRNTCFWKLSACPNLQRLHLVYCSMINIDNAMRALQTCCTQLKVLDLAWCNVRDSTMEELSGCTELVELNLKQNANFSQVGLELLVEGSMKLKTKGCRKLEKINLLCCNVNDTGVQALAYNCPRLCEVILPGWSSLTDDTAIALSTCKNLRVLSICGSKIADKGLKLLCSQCSLRDLDVQRCNLITDAGMREAVTCLTLRKINITCSANISAEMKASLRNCRRLLVQDNRRCGARGVMCTCRFPGMRLSELRRLRIRDHTWNCAASGGLCTCRFPGMCLSDIMMRPPDMEINV